MSEIFDFSRVAMARAIGLWLLVGVASPLAAAQGISVTARPVSELVVADSQSAPAEVVPANRTRLAAEVTARIANVAVDVGASVKKGDLLVQLDDTDYTLALRRIEASIASLEAQIEQAQIRLRRAESLVAKQFTSQDDVLERATALAVLKRSVEAERVAADIARVNVARTRIAAPFDGEIEARSAQQGAYATVGSPLLTLTQTGDSEISAKVNPRVVASLTGAELRFESEGGDYPVRVARVAQVIDPDSRLQTVRLTFAAAAAPVGATGSLVWASAGGLVPAHLVVQRKGTLGLFVADGAQARFHALVSAAEGRAVSHGLAPDALLIVEGRTRLQDGDAISLRNP